jgi:methionyl-tRNA formyltransferase
MRILLFGDGDWATHSLRRLAQGEWDLIGLVIREQPSAPSLLELANTLGLPLFQPSDINSPGFVEKVTAMHPDLNLSVSYDQILHRPIRNTAPRGFVNFHAGKLPYYRGRNVINWAIINGETEIGLTAHYVDEGIDTGDIILQRTLPISWTDTYGDVLDRVVDAFPDLVFDTVKLIEEDRVERRQQAHLMGTYYPKRGKGDEWLDWSDSSYNLHNKIRAITRPGPGARTLLNGNTVIVWQAFYDPSWPDYFATPGQVVGRSSEGAFVKTGDSILLVKEVQVEDGESHKPDWPLSTRLGLRLMPYLRKLEERLVALENLKHNTETSSHG